METGLDFQKKMKNILVPCDFSTASKEALKFAVDIASKTKGRVSVLHVIYTPVMYDTFAGAMPIAYNPEFVTGMEEEARSEFETLCGAYERATVKPVLEITQGDIVSSIKRLIERKHADAVVMGTTGSSGLAEIFVGSNTEKVVRNVSVPVFTVRTAPSLDSIKHILLPIPLEPGQTAFMRKVKELQAFFKARLHLLLINTPSHFLADQDAERALEKFARQYRLENCETHFRNFRKEENGIIDFATSENMDMIAMGTHARKGLSHLFNGSITENVVNHIQYPVWTYSLKV